MRLPQTFISKASSEKLEQILDEFGQQIDETVSCEGYDKRVFPSKRGINNLNKAYDCVRTDGLIFDMIGKRIGNYESVDRPTTSDRYTWFWRLKFNSKEGGIAVLFPWCQNRDKLSGLALDRSIEVHIKGKVGMEEVETIIKNLYQEFQKLGYDNS